MFRSKKLVKPAAGKARDEARKNDANRKSSSTLILTGVAIILTPCFFLTPEGAIREGDALPCVLLFLLLSSVALWLNYRFFTGRSIEYRPYSVEINASVSQEHAPGTRSLLARVADVALVAYLLFATLSYLQVIFRHTADVRLSTNAYWSFVTPVLFFFFIRYFAHDFSRRAIVSLFSLLVACSFAESVFSIYSQRVIMPQSQAAYRADPEKVLKESGFDFPDGSSERLLFEKRLLDSTEPTGTYGLANTLGCVLAPLFLISLVGYPWRKLYQAAFNRESAKRGIKLISGLIWTLGLLLTLLVLIETKSRSSVLALIVGLVLWFILNLVEMRRSRTTLFRRLFGLCAVAVCVIAVILIIAFILGVIDREVFTEAGKSLGYRLDYWRATSAMICDHPLLGVGPGEFQSVYARYILPTASEFIADPHNFLFEISALFGVPALLAFLAFILSISFIGARDVYLSGLGAHKEESLSPTDIERPTVLAEICSERVFFALTWGSALGLVATLATSILHSTPLTWRFYPVVVIPFVFAFIAAFAMISSAKEVELETSFIPTKVMLAALATSLANLCFAGGIGYFPISMPLMGLFAVVANGVKVNHAPPVLLSKTRRTSLALFLGSLCVLLVFYVSALMPRNASFLISASSSLDARTMALLASGDYTKIDSYSSSVAQQCYFFAGANYLKSPSSENEYQWKELGAHIKSLAPNSSPIRETCGDYNWSLFLQNRSRAEFADAALKFYREAVELSPTDVHKREKLANALMILGRNEEALIEVKIALQYDAVNPHEDRKLSDGVRAKYHEFLEQFEQ